MHQWVGTSFIYWQQNPPLSSHAHLYTTHRFVSAQVANIHKPQPTCVTLSTSTDTYIYIGLQMSETTLKISNIVTQTGNYHKIRGIIQKNDMSEVQLLFQVYRQFLLDRTWLDLMFIGAVQSDRSIRRPIHQA